MTEDDKPSATRPALDEIALFERLREEAKREQAPATLAARIFDRIEADARRERLLERPPKARSGRVLVALGLGLTLAAGVALLVSSPRSAPSIAREPVSGGAPTTPVAHPMLDPCSEPSVATGRAPAIDDFEDGDDAVLPNERRQGFWRWARETDAKGTAPALLPIPRPNPTPDNRLALHIKGPRLSDWGATIEFTFRPPCYDASTYGGVAFSARGPGRIYVAPREVSVIPISEGGTCERDCHNPHVQKVDLDGRFRTYEVRFEELRQRGFDKLPLDSKRLNSMAFLVRAEDTPYDVWIDDVRFIAR
jgi:hypothetical protein